MNYQTVPQRLFVTLLLFVLVGCGFHLRGQIQFPTNLKTMAVISQVNDPFIESIRQRLSNYGVTVVDKASQAGSTLSIVNLTHHSAIGGISSSTNTRQYTLTYQLIFSLTIDKQPVLTNQTVSSSRTLTVDSNRILGSDDEEVTLKQEMQQDLLRKLMARIAAQYKHPN